MYATITSPSITSVELHPMRQALLGAIADADGTRTLIVHMEQVEFISSQALGMLVEVHTAARSREIRLLLAGVHQSIREMLEVTKVTRAFSVCSTPEELAAALGG
jgi:anti-anti-sigma factor